MASKTVTVRNADKDTKDLGSWTAKGRVKDGEGLRIFLGSTLDAGLVGAAQPDMEVPREVWARAVTDSKAIRGLMEGRQITVTEGPLATLSPRDFLGQKAAVDTQAGA